MGNHIEDFCFLIPVGYLLALIFIIFETNNQRKKHGLGWGEIWKLKFVKVVVAVIGGFLLFVLGLGFAVSMIMKSSG